MKRKPVATSSTRKSNRPSLQLIERRLSLVLQLLEHNIVQLLRYRRAK